MKVFIANFGQSNYLWPDCLARGTVATFDSEQIHKFWLAGDRKGYIEYALANMKTVRGETPTRPVASRWYGLMDVISDTSGDLWIHREKEQLWWTVSRDLPVESERKAASGRERNGDVVFELHKPSDPWSDRSRKGAQLSWAGLHPKARDFLFTEGTLQQLSPEYADYAQALINGDDLSPWHDLPVWRAKVERTKRNPGISYNARQKAVWRMADTVRQTVAQANGQQVLRTLKNKLCGFSNEELLAYIDGLITAQDGVCALTGLALQYDGDADDPAMLASLDRIDSGGHYVADNLQVVCRFVNRWKSDAQDEEFRRLLSLVRAVTP